MIPLLTFKSGLNTIICHIDKVDYFIISNEIKSGVVVNGNFHKIDLSSINEVVKEYKDLMELLEN